MMYYLYLEEFFFWILFQYIQEDVTYFYITWLPANLHNINNGTEGPLYCIYLCIAPTQILKVFLKKKSVF
jgi:hypothetical protein